MSVQIFCYMNYYYNEPSTCLYHQIPYPRLATVCNCSLFMTEQVVLTLKSSMQWYLMTEEEFYKVTESSFDLSKLRQELLEREQVYNTVRPHQALGYLTHLNFQSSGKNVRKRGYATNHLNEHSYLTFHLVSDILPMVQNLLI